MLKIGITGGIGSGKSTVCRVFKILGVPVFNADDAAKELMNTDEALIKSIQIEFGAEIYKEGRLDRPALAAIVFNNEEALNRLNHLVHPPTINYFVEWTKQYSAKPYVLKEAAIIFESGSSAGLDKVITVSAPETLRIQRIIKRDGGSEENVRARMKNQLPEEERIKRADYVIYNDEVQAVIPQVLNIHQQIIGL
jgi:dephospho-CoA kinase